MMNDREEIRRAARSCFIISLVLVVASFTIYWLGTGYAIRHASPQELTGEDSGVIVLPWIVYALIVLLFAAVMALLAVLQFLRARRYQ